MFVVSITTSLAAPPTTTPEDPPTHAVTVTLEGHGLPGHLLADADRLATLKITLSSGTTPRTGKLVPLVAGLRVLGLPQGERLVQGSGVDTVMSFDANGDGYFDAADPVFSALLVFHDTNADGKAQASEVKALGAAGLDSISKYGSVRMKE